MPHRAPGSPGHGPGHYLQGKQIRYYRPAGSADVRQLIEGGFQAFNAGRLSEACHIYADKMLAPASDTTIGLTVAGALTPAGLGGCVIELMERGLIDFMISTGANLYHDLHYALNFQLHRGSPFLDDVDLYEQGIIRIYDVLFPATVLLETDAYIRGFLVGSGLHGPIASSEFHYRLGLDLLERNPPCAEYSVVAKAAQCGLPIYTSSPGDSSIGMNIAYHELMNDSNLMIDPNKDVNTDQVVWGGLSGATPAEAVSWGKVNPGVLPDTVVAYCDSTIAFPLFCEYAVGSEHNRRPLRRLIHKREALVADLVRQAKAARKDTKETMVSKEQPAEVDRRR